jgi:hypothetical protein
MATWQMCGGTLAANVLLEMSAVGNEMHQDRVEQVN